MTTPYYTIKALGPTAAEIYIYGEIGESYWEETVSARALVAELAGMTSKALTVYINSPGGSVMDAAAIYSALNRHTMPVSIIVDGWALSAASLIAMAGQSLTMGTASMLMLHNPSAMAYGNADDLRKTADSLDAVRQTMISVYAAKSGADEATVAGWLDAETWFDADAAITAKLADAKAETTARPAPAPTAQFRNLPAAYAAYLQPQEPVMTDQTPTPSAPDATLPPTAPPPASSAPDAAFTAADIKAQISAVIAAERQAERTRQAAIRASFKTFFDKLPMRANALSVLQEQVLADGSSPQEADHKLLELLGSFSEPLAAGQGATEYTGSIDPMAVSVAAAAYQREMKAAGRVVSMTDAVAHVIKQGAE